MLAGIDLAAGEIDTTCGAALLTASATPVMRTAITLRRARRP